MTTKPTPRALLALLVSLLLPVAARPAAAKAYTLPELLELARKASPSVAAGVSQTAQIEAQLSEARRSWLPSGELLSVVAPVPEIRCFPSRENCTQTNISEASLNLKGVFTRTELKLVQPVYTFGKIAAGIDAAEAGIAASKSRENGIIAEVELNVRRAYWGAKLAREILETVKDGMSYLDQAQAQIEKNLKEGTGTSTVTDRLRLQVMRADVDGRVLEADKLRSTALSGLRALLGPESPADLDVDPEPLEVANVPERPLAQYEEQARLSRPEVVALNYLVISKRALADFERRKQYPDLVLIGTATYAFASSIDNPKNAFFNDPFNTASAGLAAALRMPLDVFARNARAAKVRAEAEEAVHRRREALGGIAFEVDRAHADLVEAQKRLKVMQVGEKRSKAWITAVAQNFAAGLAETKDFSDALLSFFQFRVKVLQATFDVNLASASLGRAVGGEVTR
jgi:multidrug efflux system outer membrane protein